MIGFGCELLGMAEINENGAVDNKREGKDDLFESNNSIDSVKLRGDSEDSEEIDAKTANSSTNKLNKVHLENK